MSREEERNNLLPNDDRGTPISSSQSSGSRSSSCSVVSLSEISESINPYRSLTYIFILAIIIGGLQLSWCTEFSEGTPFLLSLGISKDALALIWIAGPLSGSLGQPIIGIFSDNSTNKSGRRKPFIIGGCIATCFSLFYLSYSVDLVSLLYPKGTSLDHVKKTTRPFAALGVYMLDFSISAIQATSRAYIVDNVSSNQQQLANAMAAVLIGGFNIIGYFLGSINLLRFLPFLGASQFKILAAVASIVLILACVFSLTYIEERDPTTDVVIKAERKRNAKRVRELGLENTQGVLSAIKSLFRQTMHSITRLSPQTRMVCLAEFFAWIGYFPMLFYTTTYVGEIYKYEFFQGRDPSLPPLTTGELLALQEDATRMGATALLLNSVTSFLVDLFLPLLVQPFDGDSSSSEPKFLQSNIILDYIERCRLRFAWWLTVRNSWYMSHILFVVCMFSTFFITSSSAALVLFAILGITWGNALWSPFVLISEEISRIKEIKAIIQKRKATNPVGLDSAAVDKYETYEHESGIILGLHNFFVAAPQVISSLLSSVLFRYLSKQNNDGSEFDESLGWVFRFGGLATIPALILSIKVRTNEQLREEEQEIKLEEFV